MGTFRQARKPLHHGFAYAYDAMGRIATITETGETPRVTTHTYDSAGRLWQVWRDGTQVAQYDHLGADGANGNRTAWTAGGHSFTASYDGQDRLTGYADNGTATTLGYDVHGNVQTRTTGADVTTYTWDARGPLASVQRPGGAALIEYVLDPAGRRIGRRVGGSLERGWLYAGGLLPVAETDVDGHTVRRVFVYATRPNVPDLVQQLEGASWVTYRVGVDHLGSVRSVVRASDGAVVQRMDYDAFGGVVDDWSASGWVRIPFGFAGGLYDRDTGLVRFGAREYDARVGRWISRDPALFGGRDSNLYRYCGGEPVNFIDVDGLVPWQWLRAAARVVGTGIRVGARVTFFPAVVEAVTAAVYGRLSFEQAERLAEHEAPFGERIGTEISIQPDRQTDAYRHCIAACFGADMVGGTVIRQVGNAMEYVQERHMVSDPVACSMDRHNNSVGANFDANTCMASCSRALADGGLRIIEGRRLVPSYTPR